MLNIQQKLKEKKEKMLSVVGITHVVIPIKPDISEKYKNVCNLSKIILLERKKKRL